VAVQAVLREPVSHCKFPDTLEIQGNFAKQQGMHASALEMGLHQQRFFGKFPKARNREFVQSIREYQLG
jgi:hypothetical protein